MDENNDQGLCIETEVYDNDHCPGQRHVNVIVKSVKRQTALDALFDTIEDEVRSSEEKPIQLSGSIVRTKETQYPWCAKLKMHIDK